MTPHATAARQRGDATIAADTMLRDVLDGLAESPRKLLPKYFYDDAGARLFERICELDEYYLTRTELAIMRECIGDIAAAIGADARVIELGSGAGLKTRLLLQRLDRPREYVPIDIAAHQLRAVALELRREFPGLAVTPVAGDYTARVRLPPPPPDVARTVVYFPGSTIGNFEPTDALAFLRRVRRWCGSGGCLLLGTDMHKDTASLERAYNDARGVTAAFNLNLLRRINRELGADFDLTAFEHRAVYDEQNRRIEMHLVCRKDATITIAGQSFAFRAGEHILTEYSHKYTAPAVRHLARRTGWRVADRWPDPHGRFTIWLLRTRA